jgi:hypothetical protein
VPNQGCWLARLWRPPRLERGLWPPRGPGAPGRLARRGAALGAPYFAPRPQCTQSISGVEWHSETLQLGLTTQLSETEAHPSWPPARHRLPLNIQPSEPTKTNGCAAPPFIMLLLNVIPLKLIACTAVRPAGGSNWQPSTVQLWKTFVPPSTGVPPVVGTPPCHLGTHSPRKMDVECSTGPGDGP